jgi:hypothetical protein
MAMEARTNAVAFDLQMTILMNRRNLSTAGCTARICNFIINPLARVEVGILNYIKSNPLARA